MHRYPAFNQRMPPRQSQQRGQMGMFLNNLGPNNNAHHHAARAPHPAPSSSAASSTLSLSSTSTTNTTAAGGDEYFLCPICSASYKGIRTCANHLHKHHHEILKCEELPLNPQNLSSSRLYPSPMLNSLTTACGLCDSAPFRGDSVFYNHVVTEHCRGNSVLQWDISIVVRNHLREEKLEGFFDNWVEGRYGVGNRPYLRWERESETLSMLRVLQVAPYEDLTEEAARGLVESVCAVRAEAFYKVDAEVRRAEEERRRAAPEGDEMSLSETLLDFQDEDYAMVGWKDDVLFGDGGVSFAELR